MPSRLYSEVAEQYDAAIQENIYNALLVRPTLLAMLPPLKGLKVLNLGCGPGEYAQFLHKYGAEVTCIDASEQMLELVKTKLGGHVKCYTSDLSQGMPKGAMWPYDLVICPLMIHYIEDLTTMFSDIAKVLKPDGSFIFSTHHPLIDAQCSPRGAYLRQEYVTGHWNTIGQPVEVSFYRRPLSMLFGWLANAGLAVVDLHEGAPAAEMKEKSPVHYVKLVRNPSFIFFKCQRHSAN